MAHGQFIWADVSSFRPEVTRAFYNKVFGWRFDGYVGQCASGPVAGLFEMPEFFQKIRMPSFWMSYIAVDDVVAAIETATAQGGKVELGPEPFEGGGQIALIRDPLGAGFTVYQGDALAGVTKGPFARVVHGLFVSDANAVRGFYQALFGWSIGEAAEGVAPIRNGDAVVAHLHEIPDPAIRGPEQYWAVMFSCPDLAAAQAAIAQEGGEIVADTNLPEGRAIIARDPDGAVFFLLAENSHSKPVGDTLANFAWKAWGGLALMLAMVALDWVWLWAVFLGIWVFTALRDRETWLFQRVSLATTPILYWTLVFTYIVLALLSLAALWG